MEQFAFDAMTAADAAAICRWRYPPPLTVYSLGEADRDMLLTPAFNYHVVRDAGGGRIGFACFGEDAQVIGGRYNGPALDIGCSLAPELVGRGRGLDFVCAVVGFAWRRWSPPALRLSVATSNRRAVTVYRRAGFREIGGFLGTTRNGRMRFALMLRPLSGQRLEPP